MMMVLRHTLLPDPDAEPPDEGSGKPELVPDLNH